MTALVAVACAVLIGGLTLGLVLVAILLGGDR